MAGAQPARASPPAVEPHPGWPGGRGVDQAERVPAPPRPDRGAPAGARRLRPVPGRPEGARRGVRARPGPAARLRRGRPGGNRTRHGPGARRLARGAVRAGPDHRRGAGPGPGRGGRAARRADRPPRHGRGRAGLRVRGPAAGRARGAGLGDRGAEGHRGPGRRRRVRLGGRRARLVRDPRRADARLAAAPLRGGRRPPPPDRDAARLGRLRPPQCRIGGRWLRPCCSRNLSAGRS